jgi:M6 family metalloprotease-like protein
MKKIGTIFTLLLLIASCDFSMSSGPIPTAEPLVPSNLKLGQSEATFWSIPATGTSRVLVVPVEFPDRRFINPTLVREQLDLVFNQSSTSNFVSLKQFYLTSSFGKLTLEGVVTPIFQTRFHASYYENLLSADPNTVIIDEIMSALNPAFNFRDFDSNQDGRLDGIYMIYNYPPGQWMDFWWAYLNVYQGQQRFDTIAPSSYIWLPYEFMVVNGQLTATTFIHETGHMLGLEDYYDYAVNDGSGNEYGLGGADMMDSNVGDHNPFSKMMLGWIDPLVVTEDMDVTLLPYISSGQALLITDRWQNSLFDEYIIAMYYTPTGLYRGHDDFYFDGRSGMVLYHVDARLGPNLSQNYPTHFLNNNTDSTYKLIRFIEADGNNSLYFASPPGWMWASDVYRPRQVFRGNRNLGYRWNQTARGQVGFTIGVGQEAVGYQNLTVNIRFTTS